MKILKTILITSFFLFPQGGKSQLFDQIRESFKQESKFYFNWGSQYSFISGDFASIKNIKMGLDFAGISRFGIGYNWLSSDFETRRENLDGGLRDYRLNMHYLTLFAEYTFYRSEKWEASIPAQAGFGFAWNSYYSSGEKINRPSKFFVVYEPLMTIQYRLFRYLATGVGIGYRLMLINRSSLRENFTSPLLILKTRIYFTEIWEDVIKISK